MKAKKVLAATLALGTLLSSGAAMAKPHHMHHHNHHHEPHRIERHIPPRPPRHPRPPMPPQINLPVIIPVSLDR